MMMLNVGALRAVDWWEITEGTTPSADMLLFGHRRALFR